MICLYWTPISALATAVSSSIQKSTDFVHTNKDRSLLYIYKYINCHVPDSITFPSSTSLFLPLILAEVWHEDLVAFLKHCFQTNSRGEAIQLPGNKYHSTWPRSLSMRADFPSPRSFHRSYCCCSSGRISREHDPQKAERAAGVVAVTSCKTAASRMRQWCAWMTAAVLRWHRQEQGCNHSQVQQWEFWGIRATPAPVAL